MRTVTKLTILISISVIISVLMLMAIMVLFLSPSDVIVFVIQCVGVIDVYTNFVNGMLTKKMFESEYERLCGSLDSAGNVGCNKYTVKMRHNYRK